MIEALNTGLGFVSASLVALIALGFGAMFLFFSGSAALILGHFLRFVGPARVALPWIGAAALALGALALALGQPLYWAPPLFQAASCLCVWGLLRWRAIHRWLAVAAGVAGLAAGALFVTGLARQEYQVVGLTAVQVAAALLLVALVGLWPLVIAGLVRHRQVKPFEWFISLRYLVARRRQTFISIISLICVGGVALGVAVITVVLSVMNGFAQMWEDKVIGARAHFTVHSRLGEYSGYDDVREALMRVPGVAGATPTLATDAIVRGEGGELQAVVLKGIDAATVGSTTEVLQVLRAGSLDDLDPPADATGNAARPGVIVGQELADRFFLRLGDPLILISPLGGPPTPFGPGPRLERFRVAGVFKSDFFQFDEGYVYTSLVAAQSFMKLGDVVSAVEVRTDDAYRSRAIAQAASGSLGGMFFARDWKDFYPGLFQALKTERVMMFVLLSFIMVVAGFIIVATLIMMIMEKSRDIAILKTMGCDDEGVLRIFAIQGFLIGVGGLLAGLAMGLVITVNLDTIQGVVERLFGIDVLPATIYQLSGLPYDVDAAQLSLIAAIAMVLSVGATLLPSWQAARLDPAEALRYE